MKRDFLPVGVNQLLIESVQVWTGYLIWSKWRERTTENRTSLAWARFMAYIE